MNGFHFALIGVGFLGLVGWALYEDAVAFDKHVAATYAQCVADGANKWTCEAVVSSMRAKRSADDAAALSAAYIGIAAGSAGRR